MRYIYFLSLALILFTFCDKDDDNEPPGGNGPLAIESTSPEYTFWGEELTINGTGFSTSKADNIVYVRGNQLCGSSDDTSWMKAEVVDATASRLVIKVPYFTYAPGGFCGHDYGTVSISTGGNSTISDTVKFVGLPYIGGTCAKIGEFFWDAYVRPGDSAVLKFGLGGIYAQESGYMDKLILTADGAPVSTARRAATDCSGLAFFASSDIFARTDECTILPGTSEPAHEMKFTLSVRDTDVETSDVKKVLNFPLPGFQVTGPVSVLKSDPNNPRLILTGRNIHFSSIEWKAPGLDAFYTSGLGSIDATQADLPIPLSQMNAGNTYSATGFDACQRGMFIGSVSIHD